jgi:hypothetical protein
MLARPRRLPNIEATGSPGPSFSASLSITANAILFVEVRQSSAKTVNPLRRKRCGLPCSIIQAVALILNCRIATAQQDQYSANSIMVDCREEAALIPFSNPSNEHSDLAHFCLGIIVGLSYRGRSDGTICVPVGETRQQVVGGVVQYIDSQPARTNENFVPLAIEALQAIWPRKH